MASAPPAMMQDPSTDASAPEADATESGYKICIAVAGDGSITVGVENESGEAPEGAESPEGAPGSAPATGEDEDAEMGAMQPAPNIKAALTMALAIYKSNGEQQDNAGDADQFKAGFGGSSAGA